MGAAGVEELPLALDLVLELLSGRCECLLKVPMGDAVKIFRTPCKVMMASMFFEI